MDLLSRYNDFKDYWIKHGYLTIVVLSIVFILLLGMYNYFFKEEGTWSDDYNYYPKMPKELYNVLYDSNSLTKTYSKSKGSKGERECRRVLEMIFEKPFPNVRPRYLNNDVSNENLELDCYNRELGLAVEYNGKQHYEYNSFFHKDYSDFKEQKYRDTIKKQLCEKYDITLIVVPYTVKLEDIQEYLIKELRIIGYSI